MTDAKVRDRRRELVKLHLMDEHLIAIGHVSVRSAILDLIIELGVDLISKSFTKTVRKRLVSISTEQKVDILGEAFIAALPRNEDAIKDFINDVSTSRKSRAEIMHGMWSSTKESAIKELVDARHWSASKRPNKKVTAKDMMTLATKMIDLSFEFSDWMELRTYALMRQRVSSSGISFPPSSPPNPPRTSEKGGPRLSLGYAS